MTQDSTLPCAHILPDFHEVLIHGFVSHILLFLFNEILLPSFKGIQRSASLLKAVQYSTGGSAILPLVGCFLIFSDAITTLHTTLHTRTFLGQLFRSRWPLATRPALYSPIPSAFSQAFLGLNLFASHDIEDCFLNFLSCPGHPSVSASLESFLLPTKAGISQNPLLLSLVLHDGCVFSLPSSLSESLLNHFASPTASQLQPQHLNKPPK